MHGVAGGSFAGAIILYADKEKTVPFPLSPYTVELEIDGIAILTEGDGITVIDDAGRIDIQLTPEQTRMAKKFDATRYRVKLTRGGNVDYPVHGWVRWRKP